MLSHTQPIADKIDEQRKLILINTFLQTQAFFTAQFQKEAIGDKALSSYEILWNWLDNPMSAGKKYQEEVLSFGKKLHDELIAHQALEQYKIAMVANTGDLYGQGLNSLKTELLNTFFAKFPDIFLFFENTLKSDSVIMTAAQEFSHACHIEKTQLPDPLPQNKREEIIKKANQALKTTLSSLPTLPKKEEKHSNQVCFFKSVNLALSSEEYEKIISLLYVRDDPQDDAYEVASTHVKENIKFTSIIKEFLDEKITAESLARNLLIDFHGEIWSLFGPTGQRGYGSNQYSWRSWADLFPPSLLHHRKALRFLVGNYAPIPSIISQARECLPKNTPPTDQWTDEHIKRAVNTLYYTIFSTPPELLNEHVVTKDFYKYYYRKISRLQEIFLTMPQSLSKQF